MGRHFSDSDFYHPRYEISPESEELRPEIRRDRASSALAKLDEQENEDGNRWLTVESSEETGKVQFAYYGKRVSFGLPNNRLFGVDIAYKGDPERNPDTLRATWMP